MPRNDPNRGPRGSNTTAPPPPPSALDLVPEDERDSLLGDFVGDPRDETRFNAVKEMAGGSAFIGALTAAGLKGAQINDFAGSHLRASLARNKADREKFRGLRNRLSTSISGMEAREGRRLANTASARAAHTGRSPTTSFRGSLEDATRRAKVRSQIVQRGQPAIAGQQLKDRVAFVKRGQQRVGTLQTALQSAANIRAGVNVGVQDANARIAASNAALAGGVLGGVTGLITNLPKRTPDVNPADIHAPPTNAPPGDG